MKKLWIMIQNEAIKMFKRKSTIALVIAMIIFCAAMPAFSHHFTALRYDDSEMRQQEKEFIEKQLSEIKDTPYDKVHKSQLEANKHSMEIMDASGVENREWRDLIESSYYQSLIKLKVFELADEGLNKMHLENLPYYDENFIDKILNMSKEARKVEKQYHLGIAKQMEEYIKSKNYGSFFATESANIQTQINQKKEDLKNPGEMIIANLENEIMTLENRKRVCDYIISNKVSLGDNSQSKILAEIYSQSQNIMNPIMSEKDYLQYYAYSSSRTTYEKYIKGIKANVQATQERIEIYWYGLENNIPPMNSDIAYSYGTMSGARIESYKQTNILLSFLIGLVILISAGLIASEYSKKTITSLLVYCPNRMKLIAAKMLFVLLTAIAMAIIGITLIQITNGFIYGFKDLFTPVLKFADGRIVRQSFFLLTIQQGMLCFVSLIALGALTLFISALTKNVIASVVIPLLLLLTAPMLTNVLIDFGQNWVYSTFLPFLELHFLEKTNMSIAQLYFIEGSLGVGIAWMLGITLICVLGIVYKFKTDDV